MKLRTIFLALLLALGASFLYFFVQHRDYECRNITDCYHAFVKTAEDKYSMFKDRVRGMFSPTSCCRK